MQVLVISPLLIGLYNVSKQHSSGLMTQCFHSKAHWKRSVYPTTVWNRINGQPYESLPHGIEKSPVIFEPQ